MSRRNYPDLNLEPRPGSLVEVPAGRIYADCPAVRMRVISSDRFEEDSGEPLSAGLIGCRVLHYLDDQGMTATRPLHLPCRPEWLRVVIW